MTPAESAEGMHQKWQEECRQRTAKLMREWWREGIKPDQSASTRKASQ